MNEKLIIAPGGEHDEFQEEVIKQLNETGWLVDSKPYHKTMKRKIVKYLQHRNSPTALYVRLREDNMACHIELRKEFLFEIKTQKTEHGNFFIEALQVAHRINAMKIFGVKILYICRTFSGFEFGFWIHKFPLVEQIVIPTGRWTEKLVEYFEKTFDEVIIKDSDSPVFSRKIGATRGSDDPFLVIDEEEIKRCNHWKNLIYDYKHDFEVVE